MNDEIKYLHLCGRLLTGKGIDACFFDSIKADNILYGDFGMSSEDIMAALNRNSYSELCK